MAEYPKVSRKFSKRLNGGGWKSKLKMFLITGAFVFIVISFFWGEFGFFRMWYLAKKIDRLEKDIRVLQVQRNDILWETDKIQNDPQYIQRYAVEKYGYARPDQKIIQFVPPDSSSYEAKGITRQSEHSGNGPVQNRSVHNTR
jgi:cell division protein FtsB